MCVYYTTTTAARALVHSSVLSTKILRNERCHHHIIALRQGDRKKRPYYAPVFYIHTNTYVFGVWDPKFKSINMDITLTKEFISYMSLNFW